MFFSVHPRDVHHHMMLGFTLLAILVGVSNADAQGGWSYSVVIPPLTPAPQSSFTAVSGTCKEGNGTTSPDNDVPDGGFIKTNTTLKTDVWVNTAGQCSRYIFGQWYDYQYHYIAMARVEQLNPGSSNWAPGYFNNYTPAFTMNSIPGTNPNPNPPPADNTTPAVSLGVNLVGEYRFRYKTFASTTDCAFPLSSAYSEKTLNAVACLPTWRTRELADHSQQLFVPRFPQDGLPIVIAYPNLDEWHTVVNDAVTAFQTLLSSYGLSLPLLPVAGATCDNADGHCVQVGYNVTPCQPNACSCGITSIPPSGIYDTPSYVSILHDYLPAFKTWMIAHELGHLLGLGDKDATCAADNNSVMRVPPVTCNTVPIGQTTLPTAADALPVVRSPYGGGPFKTCGW